MANRARPSQQKRQRERARLDRQKDKAARRMEAKARKAAAPRRSGDEDPDIAGIRPGPQPVPWQDELDTETLDTENDTENEDQQDRGN